LRILGIGIGLLALIALGLFVLGACASTVAQGVVSGTLAPCPTSPNCVSSEPGSGDHWVEPFAYEGDGRAVLARFVALVEELPRVEIVTREADYAHAAFTTKWMRFTDDLELRIDESSSVIHVRSASRLGHSDLGANRDRVESLRPVFAQAVTEAAVGD
jgi:uncharacterized protein (DUF1499 family)